MKYLALLQDIDYLTYIGGFIKWSLVFLAVSIVLLLLGRRFKLFRRNKKAFNLLAKAYYVIIPIYFLVFAFQFAPIKIVQTEFNDALDDNKQVIVAYTHQLLDSLDVDHLLDRKHSIKEVVESQLKQIVVTTPQTEGEEKSFFEQMLDKIMAMGAVSYVSDLVESQLSEQTATMTGLSEETSASVYNKSLSSLFEEGEIVEIFRKEVDGFFGGYYTSLFVVFLIGFLIFLAEIVLAKVYKY